MIFDPIQRTFLVFEAVSDRGAVQLEYAPAVHVAHVDRLTFQLGMSGQAGFSNNLVTHTRNFAREGDPAPKHRQAEEPSRRTSRAARHGYLGRMPDHIASAEVPGGDAELRPAPGRLLVAQLADGRFGAAELAGAGPEQVASRLGQGHESAAGISKPALCLARATSANGARPGTRSVPTATNSPTVLSAAANMAAPSPS